MDNSLDFDESIYENKEFKKHEPFVFPIVKNILLLLMFLKSHRIFIDFLKILPESDDKNISKAQNELIQEMFTDFKSNAEIFLQEYYTFDDSTIDTLILNYDITQFKIQNSIEKGKIELRDYIIQNSISKAITIGFFHQINSLENS